jgi:hypothetical protein
MTRKRNAVVTVVAALVGGWVGSHVPGTQEQQMWLTSSIVATLAHLLHWAVAPGREDGDSNDK